jgi:hypothetical protein
MAERALGRLGGHGQCEESPECVQLATTDELRSTIVQNTRTTGSNASTITIHDDLGIGPLSAIVSCVVVIVRSPADELVHATCQ